MGMERRAASHTEEEEMNQRRKLLNAARRGDTKAISKLFELYQVRVLSGEQLAKVNKTMVYMAPVAPEKGGRSSAKGSKSAKASPSKPTKPAKPVKAQPEKRLAIVKTVPKKPATVAPKKKPPAQHKAKRKAKHR
jgi:hypothetical protein